MKYEYNQRPGTRFSEASDTLLKGLRGNEYSVLVGRNNCGKSFILKSLTQEWGQTSSYLGPARYQNFNLLGYYTPNSNRKNEKYRQFLDQWRRQDHNLDNSPLNLQQAIAELDDTRRSTLGEIIELLLGTKLEILQTVPDNSMSQKYISCGGHNISFTSSGFRLITTLITSLLDTDYETFLIDEPELGISPEAQGILADFLFDRDHRKKFFPHVKSLVLATHSTIFLDRKVFGNNFYVEKIGDKINATKIENQAQFNKIHFFLLGNRFESLFLPSVIIIFEGKTDHKFIERTLAVRFPRHQFSIIAANSDGRVKEIVHFAKSILSDIQKSPYHDRIMVILDSQHSAGLSDELVRLGVPAQNIVKWPKNGIEYLYPPQIIESIFGGGDEVTIDGDMVIRNGVKYTKNDLAERVVARLEGGTVHNGDFNSLLLQPVAKLLGLEPI